MASSPFVFGRSAPIVAGGGPRPPRPLGHNGGTGGSSLSQLLAKRQQFQSKLAKSATHHRRGSNIPSSSIQDVDKSTRFATTTQFHADGGGKQLADPVPYPQTTHQRPVFKSQRVPPPATTAVNTGTPILAGRRRRHHHKEDALLQHKKEHTHHRIEKESAWDTRKARIARRDARYNQRHRSSAVGGDDGVAVVAETSNNNPIANSAAGGGWTVDDLTHMRHQQQQGEYAAATASMSPYDQPPQFSEPHVFTIAGPAPGINSNMTPMQMLATKWRFDRPMDLGIIATPCNFTIYGGSDTGKSSVQQTFLAATVERYVVVTAICPTAKVREMLRERIPGALIKDHYNPHNLDRLMKVCDTIRSKDEVPPSVFLMTDDLFASERDEERERAEQAAFRAAEEEAKARSAATKGGNALQNALAFMNAKTTRGGAAATKDADKSKFRMTLIKNDPTFTKFYRTSRHCNVTYCETKHAMDDTKRGNSDSLHVVAIMTRSREQLREDIFEAYFAPYFINFKQFDDVLNHFSAKGTALVLYDDAVHLAVCADFPRLPQFTTCHHDTYVALHIMYHKHKEEVDTKFATQGLGTSLAYRQALGLAPVEQPPPSI